MLLEQTTTGNRLKDQGKQFEGSLTRVVILMAITYCTLFGYMTILGVQKPGEAKSNSPRRLFSSLRDTRTVFLSRRVKRFSAHAGI